jgi:hypothetical protein
MRIFLSLYLFFSALPAVADWTNVLAVSPQKNWQIQRRQVGNLSGGDPELIDFVDLKSGKIVFSFVSTRRSADAEWSSDGSFVAINDRIATSGDFLYIFRVKEGHITLIRAPNDDSLTSSLLDLYKQSNSSGRFTVTGQKWITNSSLVIHVSGGGYGDDATFEATIHIDDQGQVLLDEKSVHRVN